MQQVLRCLNFYTLASVHDSDESYCAPLNLARVQAVPRILHRTTILALSIDVDILSLMSCVLPSFVFWQLETKCHQSKIYLHWLLLVFLMFVLHDLTEDLAGHDCDSSLSWESHSVESGREKLAHYTWEAPSVSLQNRQGLFPSFFLYTS